MECKNCGNNFEGNFCNLCGQNSKVERLNFSSIVNEISDSIFQVNRGFFFTFKELSVRPGHAIREFIEGHRKYYFKPLAYALTLSTVYFVLSSLSGLNTFLGEIISGFTGATKENGIDSFSNVLIWFADNYAYTILLLIPVFSISSYLAFLGKGYNYWENLVLNSYITGHQAIIYSISLIPSIIWPDFYYTEVFIFLFTIFYSFWTFRQFFRELKLMETILRIVFVYLLNFVLINGILFVFSLGSIIVGKV